MSTKHVAGRRGFIKQTAAMTAGLAGLGMLSEVEAATPDTGVNILGPKPGYSPQVGTIGFDADVDAGRGGAACARNDEAGPRLPV